MSRKRNSRRMRQAPEGRDRRMVKARSRWTRAWRIAAGSDFAIGDLSQSFQRDLGRPAPLKEIFRFLCRANQFYQLAPSQPERGAFRDRHERGMRCGGRDSVGAQGDRRAEFRERCTARKTNGAALAFDQASADLHKAPAKPLAKTGRVRQNRVVPTPVAGAKLSVATSIRPDPIRHQAGSDGDKTNSLAGESTA
jgi:hypothetical protein